MARSFWDFYAKDTAGNVIANARVYYYAQGTGAATDPPTGTAITGSVYSAATGGSALTLPRTTDTNGKVSLWFATAQDLDVVMTDNNGTAYKPSVSASTVSFDPRLITSSVSENAANLATDAEVTAAVAAHDIDTSVHGIADTATLALEPSAVGTGATQFVTTSGSDAADGLSWGSAKATIQAALDALPSGATGRGVVYVGPGVYTLVTGIFTTRPNIEIIGAGNGGQESALGGSPGPGSTTIIVPDDQVGFTFGDGATAIFRGPILRNLHFKANSDNSWGGVRLWRCSNWILDNVACSEFDGTSTFVLTDPFAGGGSYTPTVNRFGILIDGTTKNGIVAGNTSQAGELRNPKIASCLHGIRLVYGVVTRVFGGHLDATGNTNAVRANSIGVWADTGSASLLMFGTNVQGYAKSVLLGGVAAHELHGCRYEFFDTGVQIEADRCSVLGGSFTNTTGAAQIAVDITASADACTVLPGSISGVGTRIQDNGTNTFTMDPGAVAPSIGISAVASKTASLTLGDASLYRPGSVANVLRTDDQFRAGDGLVTKAVAGAITDGAFTAVPPSATLGVDTTNKRFYVRVGAAWEYAPLGLEPDPALDKVAYVSVDGSDSNDGRSWRSGFATVQHAIDFLTGIDARGRGGTVYVGPGLFHLTSTVIQPAAARVIGSGSDAGHPDYGGGSEFLWDGVSGPAWDTALDVDTDWSRGHLEGIRIKMGTGTGAVGLHVRNPQNSALVEDVYVLGFATTQILVEETKTVPVGDVPGFYRFERVWGIGGTEPFVVKSGVQQGVFDSCAVDADATTTTMFSIKPGGFPSEAVRNPLTLIGVKVESNDADCHGFDVSSLNPVNFIGCYAHRFPTDTGTKAAFRHSGSAAHQVTILGGASIGMDKWFEDTQAGTSILPTAQTSSFARSLIPSLVVHEVLHPSTVRRSTDSAGKQNNTLANDDTLLFAVLANEVWFVEGFLLFSGSSATHDAKLAWSVPSGCAVTWGGVGAPTQNSNWGVASAASAIFGTLAAGGALSVGSISGTFGVPILATVAVSATAGNVNLQWAQDVTEAVDLKLLKNAFLRLTRLG